jgi:hypothetical protein
MNGPNARWAQNLERFNTAPLALSGAAKLKLNASDRVFCMGSCFARNIEEALLYRGVKVLSKRIVAPEAPNRVNGIVNKFTTASMLNEVTWALSGGDGEASLIEAGDGWVDLQLSPGLSPCAHARAIERRRYFERDYFARLKAADVIILTLGLIETWRDEAAGIWQNAAPPFFAAKQQPDRFSFHVTDVAQNVAWLKELRARITTIRPDAKYIVTVSPVPLQATFTGVDVFVANMRSKSTLRAAASAFADAYEDVDYFPSYEMVMGAGERAFAADRVHVRDPIVQKVIADFCGRYLPTLPQPDANFIEALYLLANPDIDAAVRAGELASGFEHWSAHGCHEGRPLRPAAVPDWIYQAGILDPAEVAAAQ